MDLNLTEKRAAVAASSGGLGFAVARARAAEGCRVALCSRDRDRVTAAADRIRAETGSVVLGVVADVTAPGATGAWLTEAGDTWDGLDIVIPNAGGPPPGTFGEVTPDQWDAAYRLTLRSALEAAHAAFPYLGRGGAMLYLTSASVKQPVDTLFLSTVFRAGVAALAKTLADEWTPAGIRVNQLIPGRIATDRLVELDTDAARRQGVTPEAVRAGFERAIPLGRYGAPDEFAAAAAFLVSDAAAYITGATLQVDGGLIRSIV